MGGRSCEAAERNPTAAAALRGLLGPRFSTAPTAAVIQLPTTAVATRRAAAASSAVGGRGPAGAPEAADASDAAEVASKAADASESCGSRWTCGARPFGERLPRPRGAGAKREQEVRGGVGRL